MIERCGRHQITEGSPLVSTYRNAEVPDAGQYVNPEAEPVEGVHPLTHEDFGGWA